MKQWPHLPSRTIQAPGTYMVTASTYQKEHFFRGSEALTYLEEVLLHEALEFGWQLEAWAVFSNHYHLIAKSPDETGDPRSYLAKVHGTTARWLNARERRQGRKVWHGCWPTRLTYEKSYLARLNYVHQNPVRHGLVKRAEDYPYCSAKWFRLRAESTWYETVTNFPIDRVHVEDEF